MGYSIFSSSWLSVTDNSVGPVSLDTPYHLAFVYETSPLYVKMYLNGQIIMDYPLDAWGAGTYTLTNSTYNTTFGDSEYWTGANGEYTMDYVRIWDTSRTAAEINDKMTGELSCTTTGLLAQYKFDDAPAEGNNTGVTTAANCVGGGFDATLNNFALTGATSNFVNSPLFQVLPVELLSFEGFSQKNSIFLDWSTATEINNDGFYIERSSDIENWEDIDFINGNGTSLEKQFYQYEDQSPLFGANYYRLKQMDFDGKYEYSNCLLYTSPSPRDS